MIDYLYLGIFKFFSFISKYSPKCFINFYIFILSNLFYYLDFKHTKIIKANLKFCGFDEKICKDVYKKFAYFGFDFLKNRGISKDDIIKKTNFTNIEVLEKLRELNRPIIIQTAHFSNWELFSLAFGARFSGNTAIIGRNLDSKIMDSLLKDYRERFNMEVFNKKGSTKEIINWLKNPSHMLGILVDQNTSLKDGIKIKFFDHDATQTPIASSMAVKFNGIILPSFITLKDNGIYDMIFFDPIYPEKFDNNIQMITQAQADATQKMIKLSPSEYFWMHKRFKHFYKHIYD